MTGQDSDKPKDDIICQRLPTLKVNSADYNPTLFLSAEHFGPNCGKMERKSTRGATLTRKSIHYCNTGSTHAELSPANRFMHSQVAAVIVLVTPSDACLIVW